MTDPRGTLAIGFTIDDRYEVLDLLGAGKYGEVYRVRDHNLDEQSALKLLRPAHDTLPTWAEAQILVRLQSEFLLPVKNASVAQGLDLRYITTPLAEYGDLAGLARPHGAPVRQALRWCQQAANGLARVHDAGLLHRDIKAENIFLASNGTALLGDLGLAAAMDAVGTAEGDGTQYTAAPELFKPGGRCSVRSDVYSLATTTFFVLSGVWPRGEGCSMEDIARAAMSGTGPDLRDVAPHVPMRVAAVVRRGMSLMPEARHANAGDFAAELGTSAQGITRDWQRTDEHSEHEMCLRAPAVGARRAVTVCVVPAGKRWNTEIATVPAGVRHRRLERTGIPHRQIAAAVRSAIGQLQ